MKDDDICYMPAFAMRDALLNGDFTSQEITEVFIERIDRVNPLVNAYCTTTFDIAREMAKKADEAFKKGEKIGVLNGVPTSIKDLMQTKGIRTTYGSRLYENFIPDQDDIAVQRLKNAGCVILGKTNTPDFGHIALTNNLLFGQTRNPWDLEKNSGGSSGGAASASASGISPLALGSDGGGSIRVPSCLCGVYGLKPTFGRIPSYPRNGIAFWNMDHYGPIVRNVKDAALMLNVLKGPHPLDHKAFPDDGTDYLQSLEETPDNLKIGYSMDLGYAKILHEEIEKSITESVQEFERLDWDVEHVKLKVKKPENAFGVLARLGYTYDHKNDLKTRPEDLSPDLIQIVEAGLTLTGQDVIKAIAQRHATYEVFHRYFVDYDILITPTTPHPSFKLEMGERGTKFPNVQGKSLSITSWMSFTYPFNLTGLPAASIPCGWTNDGLPIGMQIIGRRYDEKTVLQVSKAFEDLSPWQDKQPVLK